MDTLTAIEKRRSIRNFNNKEVSKDILEDILNCGRLAPSAKNRQPWYFVVVADSMKDKIANMMIDFATNNNNDNIGKKLGYKSSVNVTADVIKQAPVLVLIFREKNENWIIGDNLSIGACVENMCLRATELKLGTLWIRDTVYVSKEISKMFGHEEMELNCALAIGYTDKIEKPRPRKKLEDITEWYL